MEYQKMKNLLLISLSLKWSKFRCIKSYKQKTLNEYINTSGFWPRVRARALRAPVFLGSLPRQTGRCAPTHPPPPIAASLFLI
jgi:hypothetical protein